MDGLLMTANLKLQWHFPDRSHARLRWGLLALGGGALVLALLHIAALRSQLDTLKARQTAIRGVATARSTPVQSDDETQSGLRAVHAALQQSWQPDFDALEQAARPPIALQSVKLSASPHMVRLRGRAPALEDILSYVQSLQAQAGIKSVLLERYEADHTTPTNPDPAVSTITFSIKVEMRP